MTGFTSPIRFALFTDDPDRAAAELFGGPLPGWAVICPPFSMLPSGCRALGLFFDARSPLSVNIQNHYRILRDHDQVTGMDAEALAKLAAWLEKEGRRAGEIAAPLLQVGIDVQSIKVTERAAA